MKNTANGAEQSTLGGNVNSTDKQNFSENEEMIERKPINETPFTAVKYDGKWFVMMGRYKMSEDLGSEEACIEDAKDASWHRIMQVMGVMIEEYDRRESTKKLAKDLETVKN